MLSDVTLIFAEGSGLIAKVKKNFESVIPRIRLLDGFHFAL